MRFKSNQRTLESRKFIFIIVAWLLIGVLQTIYDHFLIGSHLSQGYGEGYLLLKSLITNSLGGIMGGVLGGYTLVYLVNKKYRSAPYYKGILIVIFVFIFAVSLITLVLAFLQATVLHGGLGTEAGLNSFKMLIYTTEHVKNIIFWAVVVAITQLGLQVNDKFGQGLLWSMITGKYHHPKTEERVFMFLDLRGSTEIAEKLDSKQYHNFLKDLFSDITEPILTNSGQIYQYVGDEVIVSWNASDGITKDRCIQCFFDVQSTLQSLKTKYEEVYNTVPVFKAGVHHGKVVVGEIGIIKRDITYSGDILNTTARIQGKCNEHQTNLLISGSLASSLSLQSFNTEHLGHIPLRGKQETVELVSVEM